MRFLILAHTFSGRLGSHTCQSHGWVLVFRITQNPLPCGIYLWPIGLPFYWISFQLYCSLLITMATTTRLLLEAFLNCPSRMNPFFFCGSIPLCSFPFILVDTYLLNSYYTLGTVLGSGCKTFKKIKLLTSVAHGLIGEVLRGKRGSPTKENQFMSDVIAIVTFKKLTQGLFCN